ncbi:MAG: sulfur carrier protein ThiS [Gemmatimonadetes bacterium]|nr:sulfur carrier protein ThiS [Gemmatimonadota bacterium]NIU75874.1 sulfur carrier protein ThiS [Gammaproteobacteria bacterium]NIP80591.1 sulfur carrier protein ThiS [Gemmatimonadota bacterium]NIQ55672.1 sulfur carrier protein ThiS [Gemmatimonadota bacterium]NIX45506.1 sulfur carrier protein ThiS [Gemmatimonadota bacterium]
MSGTIRVTVNGEERQIAAGLTVEALLRSLDLQPALVVVERNREILERDRYGDVEVEAGDVLELVHFVGGG